MPWDAFGMIVAILAGAAVLLLAVELGYRVARWSTRRLTRFGERRVLGPVPARKTGDEHRPKQRLLLTLVWAPEVLVERLYRPAQLLAAVAGARAVTGWMDDADLDALEDGLRDGIYLALIWLGLVTVLWLAATVGGSTYAGSDLGRRFRSQVETLTRILSVLVVVAVIVVALITVEQARSLGTTVLAGAGLLGAVAGLAVQKTLGNMFAGIAIGFNDKLNLGDVVEVGGESGEIVERTLTYVVVKLSEQRTLVLPSSQFLDQAHTSWRLTKRKVVGWVPLAVDWGVSVQDLQGELRRAFQAKGYGDDDDLRVEVIGVTETAVQVRAMVRAYPDDLWDVQCAIREHLVGWIDAHAGNRPRVRAELVSQPGPAVQPGPVGQSGPAVPRDRGKGKVKVD